MSQCAISLWAVSHSTVEFHGVVCMGHVAVFDGLMAWLLSEFQTLKNVANVDGLQLKLFTSRLLGSRTVKLWIRIWIRSAKQLLLNSRIGHKPNYLVIADVVYNFDSGRIV